MANSYDDEDLKLAMALSLQQSPVPKPCKAVVDLTSDNAGEADDEDESLKKAIALSMQDMVRSSNTLTQQAAKSATSSASNPSAGTSFPMDRKAMEAERLARLKERERKRRRTPSPDRPMKLQSKARAPAPVRDSTRLQPHSESALQYPRGAIKRTFATKFPRTDDVTIDELLQASTVNIAVISSFQWDAEWLGRKLSHTKVKQHWIMNARDAETQARWRKDLTGCGIPNLRINFPPMNAAVGNAHSKYMLLVSDRKLRIVVSTANMEPVYWGEVENSWQPGVLENSVFLIDLPRRADGLVGSVHELTPFGKELVHFLEVQGLDAQIVKGVLKFDFSETSQLAFVHSIGTTSDTDAHPTGLPGLARAIQDLQLDRVKSIEFDYTASSLGAVDETFLQRICSAAQGLSYSATSKTTNLGQNFRIYYPTEETIKSSIGGPDCAGVISLRKAHYSSSTFPVKCLRDYVSTRKGMISHNKLLFARGRQVDGKLFAWVYVGSANISESAWGAQKVLKSGKLGKLTMRNWECGVVVPVPSERLEGLQLAEGEAPPMSVFEGTIEVPFQYPGEPYKGRTPWLQNS
ncbi:tyrosyl-DNA phosphodiesterase domain-containing protein [Didymella exigua CBS 183.55]|uniref:Tyrosyl-DNA phosphodiesterase domain-containing protein n=1 Tax=Didymella exigua CBS 183.55 TaxID=1150837 RepID=A0A6A5RMD2_9PLEO|nr:tyrosyl-DNA phosphodiesterase domain-containing protein [Didymella exigua CBS 183.55]KAF1927526.1 tyrosyl-DNA phosphodiesterase domain-containing protein [Didymella exigua CBS 183.55]